jgi:hypothetical protein
MTDDGHWVALRQVILAAEEVDPAAAELCAAFGLARGFADVMLEDIGMDDESIILGNGATYLEVVAPLRPDTGVAGWLARGGGPGGYCLSIQTDSLAPFRERAERLGIPLIFDLEAHGYRMIQLHPRAPGLLIELDEIPDPAAWFWDQTPKEIPADPHVHDVLAVELSSPDPRAQARLWGALFDVPVEERDGRCEIALGERTVRFVAGERAFLSGVELAKVPGHLAGTDRIELSGVRFDLV